MKRARGAPGRMTAPARVDVGAFVFLCSSRRNEIRTRVGRRRSDRPRREHRRDPAGHRVRDRDRGFGRGGAGPHRSRRHHGRGHRLQAAGPQRGAAHRGAAPAGRADPRAHDERVHGRRDDRQGARRRGLDVPPQAGAARTAGCSVHDAGRDARRDAAGRRRGRAGRQPCRGAAWLGARRRRLPHGERGPRSATAGADRRPRLPSARRDGAGGRQAAARPRPGDPSALRLGLRGGLPRDHRPRAPGRRRVRQAARHGQVVSWVQLALKRPEEG